MELVLPFIDTIRPSWGAVFDDRGLVKIFGKVRETAMQLIRQFHLKAQQQAEIKQRVIQEAEILRNKFPLLAQTLDHQFDEIWNGVINMQREINREFEIPIKEAMTSAYQVKPYIFLIVKASQTSC